MTRLPPHHTHHDTVPAHLLGRLGPAAGALLTTGVLAALLPDVHNAILARGLLLTLIILGLLDARWWWTEVRRRRALRRVSGHLALHLSGVPEGEPGSYCPRSLTVVTSTGDAAPLHLWQGGVYVALPRRAPLLFRLGDEVSGRTLH